MSGKPTLAWFGATGGCAFAAFNLAVKDGYTCYACEFPFHFDLSVVLGRQIFLQLTLNVSNIVVRNPAKLTQMLSERGISSDSLSNLTIIKGTLQDQSAIRDTLAPNGKAVDIIISGIGGNLMFRNCPPGFTLDNPRICEVMQYIKTRSKSKRMTH